jgi:hypothetical protein
MTQSISSSGSRKRSKITNAVSDVEEELEDLNRDSLVLSPQDKESRRISRMARNRR